jgi:cytosine/uracil/thiamine/allantoin permease
MLIVMTLSLCLALIHFGLIGHLTYALIVLVSSLLFGWLSWKKVKQYQQVQERFHTMYFFLLNLWMNTSLKGHLYEAYQDTKRQLSPKTEKIFLSYETNEIFQTLHELQAYFTFSLYPIALQTLRFYEEKGGDIMSMSDRLLKQLRTEESQRREKEQALRKMGMQFVVLWLLNLSILGLAYLVLNSLFLTMAQGVIFQGFLTCFFMYIGGSTYLWIHQHLAYE